MSGYLARLVDRGVGAPGGTVSPRLGPVFPLGPAAASTEEPGVGPDLLPSSPPESPPPRAPSPLPSDAAAAAPADPVRAEAGPVEPPPGRRPAGAHAESARARDRGPVAAPVSQAGSPPVSHAGSSPVAEADSTPVVTVTDRAIRMPEPGVPIPIAPQNGGLEASRQSSTRIDASTAAPAERPTATAVPRPNTARDPLPVRADRGSRAAPEHVPQIEVRVGRVEVRRPPEPAPEQWPAAVSQPSAAPTGFDRFAAARRYVDRRWS